MMAKKYQEIILGEKLNPEYIKKAKKIQKEKTIKVGSLEELKSRYKK